MTSTAPTASGELDDPSAVLVFARARRRDADAAQADVLVAAARWAEQHPPESILDAATWTTPGGDTGIALAGPGAPWVSEFCLAEFALAVGMSTDSGRRLVADAVELKHRLPRTWARIHAGDLPAWKARRIAEATAPLTWEAAAFVDAQVAGFAHRIGPAALDRLVADAVARFMPDHATAQAERAAQRRHVTFEFDQVSFEGTSRVGAELDLADALDLDTALARGAEQLRLAGSTESLDVRRAMAAGQLARHQTTLDLTTQHDTRVSTGSTGAATGSPVRARQVVLYVHLSQAAITGTTTTDTKADPGPRSGIELARVENHHRGVTADQVRTWCHNPQTQVTLTPVIDLNAHLHTDAYQVPARLQEQTQLRDHSCVFPWCTRPARRCDSDHTVPHAQGGTTCSCNIAPLCRRHHRLKTHSAWTYTTLEPGTFLWTSPHAYQFLRDHTGTRDVTPHPPRESRPPPGNGPPHFT